MRADEENRTPNLLITSELLCRLSYVGLAIGYYTRRQRTVKCPDNLLLYHLPAALDDSLVDGQGRCGRLRPGEAAGLRQP